jgi:hypothetical protein
VQQFHDVVIRSRIGVLFDRGDHGSVRVHLCAT